MIMTAVTGNIAEAVGPYTSAATEALDLGLVVPVALLAAVCLLRQRPLGSALALIMLVINACIGMVLVSKVSLSWCRAFRSRPAKSSPRC
jgi:hypothetical protein